MATCYRFVRHDSMDTAPHASPTPLHEQDSISVPAKGKGRIKFLVQNWVLRTKHAINDVTRSLHRRVGVTHPLDSRRLEESRRLRESRKLWRTESSDNISLTRVDVGLTDSLESKVLQGRESSEGDNFSTVDETFESEGLQGRETSEDDSFQTVDETLEDDSFSTVDSTGGNLKDDDGADIEGSEGRMGASDVLPESSDVAYLNCELSKSKQRNKELTEKLAHMQKNLAGKGQREKELTQQVTDLEEELLKRKEIIDENFFVERFLMRAIYFSKKERAFRNRQNGFLAKRMLELKQLLDDERRVNECKICYSRSNNVIIYPCLHAQYCSVCVERLMNGGRACPSCRGVILDASFRLGEGEGTFLKRTS